MSDGPAEHEEHFEVHESGSGMHSLAPVVFVVAALIVGVIAYLAVGLAFGVALGLMGGGIGVWMLERGRRTLGR